MERRIPCAPVHGNKLETHHADIHEPRAQPGIFERLGVDLCLHSVCLGCNADGSVCFMGSAIGFTDGNGEG